MKSQDKFDIECRTVSFNGGAPKEWVFVCFKVSKSTFSPSFKDLYRIFGAIVACERKKYRHLYDVGRDPTDKVKQFCEMACDQIPWEQVKGILDIPDH